MVVAVVGFKWHRRGKAKNADWRNRNAFKSLPRRNALISIFNGGGSIFSILRRFWLIENKITVSPSTAMNDPFDSIINLWATEEHLAMMCKEKSHAKPYAKSFQYNRIRCFCYGKEENVINKTLMWAHYAEEHRGICIKYQLSSHFIKQDENDKYEHMYLKKVEYTDKTIGIETPTINSAIAFATKGKEWSYENEVRLIDYNPNIETPYYGIALDTESSIESIYFGLRCEESTVKTIKALFKNHDVIPKFYKMELDRSNVYSHIHN